MMRDRRFAVVFLFIAAVLCAGAVAAETRQEGEQPEVTPEMQAEMEAWMKLAQPGEHHGHMEPFEGTWTGQVTMWMAPGAEPMLESSSLEASWILGGRFLEFRHTGNFMGMPFEGRAIEGFNNGDGRYESIWMDNYGTLMLFYTGQCSNDGKTRTMTTEFNDVVAGGTVSYKAIYTWVDNDHFTYTAFMDKGDGEFQNIEIKYTRH
jgi:hypothetical protein